MPPRYYIGTSGWHYEDWRNRFYPPDLKKDRWLEFYSSHFSTVEINNSFYRLPTDKVFASWYESTPSGFIFAVKVSRFITHIKRLRDANDAVDKFMGRAAGLKEKLVPLLYQLPPNMPRDDERLESFLRILPEKSKHVFEFRHESWFDEGVMSILRKYKAAFCVFDMPDLKTPLAATADFAYIRFHGSSGLYSSSYSDEEMSDWAERIARMAEGINEVYIYFNNDVYGYALDNARTLRDYLKA